MKIFSGFFVLNLMLSLSAVLANEELSKEINYISDNGRETKSEIICTNNQSAFIYENNVNKEILLEQNGVVEDLGKVTIDEVIEKVCS